MKKRLTAILAALSMLCSNVPAVYAAEAFTVSEEQAGSGNEEAMISDGAEAPDVDGEIHVPDETAKTEEAEETATAQEQAAQSGVRSGVCGDDLNWTLNEAGVLRINGTGEMYDYEFFKSDPPWNLYGDEYYNNHSVKSLIISEGVTSIGNVAFSRCYALESVSLPSTLQKIGNSAFEECQKLKEVIFPSGLLSIGNDAFRKCTSLAGVNIPDSVTDYGQMVFEECSAMPFIRLGKNITGATYNLRGNDFNDCTSLTSIQVSPENPSYTSVDGVLFNRSKTTLVSYPPARPGTHYTIPDTVHTIGYHAVSNCVNLTSVTVPDSVYAIDDGGFDGNEKLQHIDLGNGVRSMGIWALANCTSLESVTLPRKLQCVNYCLFAYDTALRKVFFTGSAPTFKSNAFRDVKASVYFPTNVGNGWTNEIMSPSYEGDLIWLPWNAPLTPIDGCTVTLAHESYIYDGAEKKPAVTVTLNGATLSKTSDFDVRYSNNINVGTATVTITGKGFYAGTVQKNFTITEAPKTDIQNAAVTLSQEKYTYDGAEKRPAVTVRLNGVALKENTDFSVAYSNNRNVGVATVTVTGKGSYTGTVQKTFTIEEAPRTDIKDAAITLSQEKYTYDGTEKRPAVTVRLNGVTLKENTDYTVAYSDNVNVGVAKVTVTGAGGYTGSAEKTFTIVEAPKTDIRNADITLSQESFTYDGAEKKPAVTVKLNGRTLKADVDYTVSYLDNIKAGMAKVIVTGKGNYTGAAQKTFTIQEAPKISIAKAVITLSQEKYTYDGAEKKPSVTVKLNGKTLKQNTDYTVAYSNNKNVGTAKVTVTGKGGYTGSAQKTFTITEAPKTSIAKATVTLSPESYAYDGAAKKPAVTVKLNGKTLKQNTDYTVAYSNNKNVGVAKATVTGKGSYTGTVTRTFSIVAKTKAFAWGKDNWNYNNSSSQKYFSSGKYIDQINSAYLNKLKKSLTNSEYQAIFNKSRGWIYDRFSGSCYGMSSTALLAKRGYLPYTQYKSGASSLYQLNYPLADMKVSSLVTYYQMLQVKGVIQQQYRTLPTKSHKENIQKILSLLDANPTVLVGFKKDGWGGHAVLAYGYDYGSFTWNGVSYQGRIKICDPNSSRRTSDNSQCHIYFNTKTYNWEIPYYSYASIKSSSGAKFNYVGASVNEINSGGYLSGTDKNGISDYVARIDAAAISRNRTVIKMLEQNGVYIPNHAASDDIVEDYSYVLGSEGDGTIGYNLYDAESPYKVSQEDPVKLQLSIDYGDCFLEGGSMAGKNVIFDKDGYVSVAGESADFNIAMTFNEDYPTDWFTMTVKGKNSDEASLQKVEDGYILEGENLEKIDVEANNREDSVHASFSTSYPSAYICEIDENTVGVKVDKDNNGSYETLIAKGSGEKPQAPVSIEKAKISGIKTAYTYTGKKQTPKPVVKAAGKTLLNGTDYAVSYKNNQNVGTATVTIKGKGGFTGTQKITFKINPKKTSLKSLTKGKKQITVKWKKQTAQASGYEIQCSTSKNFTKNATTLTTVKKASAASTVIKNRKAKKKYFVRIRTYKTVSGKKYYSGWSAAKNVTTK